MTTVRTWTVLDDNTPTIRKLVDRLNRKALKHGLESFTMHMGDSSLVKDDNGIDVYVMREVTIIGDTPRMNGWQFVATIQHAGEAGNIIRAVPTLDESLTIPEAYRTADTACDHCKYTRRRNDTFLVQSETEGFRQIGRNCLADFVGSDAVNNKMILAEMWSLISDGCEGASEYGYGRGEERFDLEELVAFAAQIVIKDGWVSRSKTEVLGKPATADLTLSAMDKARRKGDSTLYPSEEAVQLAKAALAWAPSWIERELARNQSADYVWNMSIVLASPYVTLRGVGLAVSVLGAYQRDQEIRLKQERENVSRHIGTVGERRTFDLTVKAFRVLEGNYGATTLITYTDADDNVLKWFASGFHEVNPGDTVRLTATIKAHSEYNGVRETNITRAKAAK